MADNRLLEVAKRGTVLPVVEYSDGSTGWGVPNLLYQPAQAVNRLMQFGSPTNAPADVFNEMAPQAVDQGNLASAKETAKAIGMIPVNMIAGLPSAIHDAVTLPRDAWQGKLSGVDEEVRRAFDMAGLAALGSFAAPRPRGSVGMGGRPTQALDMSQEARLARAKEMGFDTSRPVYHGTSVDFDAFDPERAIGSQFWSTTDLNAVKNREVGAQGHGVIKEMYHRIKNPAGWKEYDKFGIDELIARGYDGLALPDGEHVTYVAFNPNQYRSVNAAFDPAQSSSANLLAANNPRAVAQVEGAKEGIRAYHGSPHDFDRFDMSKIGTGEGAQAYGHGLYFAEREGVARSYRDKLTDGGGYNLTSADGTTQVLRPGTNEAHAAYAVDMSGGDFEKAIRQYTGNGPLTPIIRKWQADGARVGSQVDTGKMYEVNIKANPNDFLDWDKPLSQQSQRVRDIFDAEMQRLRQSGQILMSDYVKKYESGELSGQQLQGLFGTSDVAAQKWRDAGIPGIRYLDQGSRAAGEGSRNYVVFDDALIEILRKYGLIGTAAGAAMLPDGES